MVEFPTMYLLKFGLIYILYVLFAHVSKVKEAAANGIYEKTLQNDSLNCMEANNFDTFWLGEDNDSDIVLKNEFSDVELVTKLIKHEGWKSVSIVYQEENNTTLTLKQKLSELGVMASFFYIKSFNDFSQLVPATSLIPVILLCLDRACIKRIIWQECYTRKRLTLEAQLHWLIVWPELRSITQLFTLLTCCVTHIALVVRSDQPQTPCSQKIIVSVYTLVQTRGERELSLAVTINRSGNSTAVRDIFPNNRYGFNHKHFTAVTLQVKPFMFKENGQYNGFLVDILNFIARSLNFTYTLTEPPDGKYGSIENGSWNGLVGMIVRKDADMIMADISTTHLRSQVVDFTYPYNFDVATVVVKRSSDDGSSYTSYVHLYRWEIHACIWSSLILTYVFIKIIEKVNPFYKDKRVKNKSDHSTSFFRLYGALLKQGGSPIKSASQTRRLVLGSWWIFAIIMATIYSGNLIAFLTVRKLKLPFDTIAEMVAQERYTWGTYGGSNYLEFFETSNDRNFRKVAEGFKRFSQQDPSSLSTKAEEHRLKVLNGNYCFIGGKPTLEYWVSQNCQLKLLSEGFYSLLYGIGLPKNSPYTRLFSEQIIGLHETGIMAMMKAKWWPANVCNVDNRKYAKPIQLTDIQSAFYILVIGIVMTLVILLLEVLMFKIRMHFRHHPS